MKNPGKPTSLDVHSTQEPFLSLPFLGLCQSVSQSALMEEAGLKWLMLTIWGSQSSLESPLEHTCWPIWVRDKKILLKLQYPLIVSSIVYNDKTFTNVNVSQTVIKT